MHTDFPTLESLNLKKIELLSRFKRVQPFITCDYSKQCVNEHASLLNFIF